MTSSKKAADAANALGLIDWTYLLTLIFGGCCTNVWAYERLLHYNPAFGSALTFSQMLFISSTALPKFITFSGKWYLPRLAPRQVPIYHWLLQVLVLTAGSLLNNWAYAYRVPHTIQIIIRSAGLPVSMVIGRVVSKKRYSISQVLAVIAVSIGVLLSTSSPSASKPSSSSATDTDVMRYITGVSMLAFSLILTGALGLLQERTYRRYGPCWQEGLFYTHLLSIPIFLPLMDDVRTGYVKLLSLPSPDKVIATGLGISPVMYLVINLLSQLVCVAGVNRLSSRVSSVSTNLVLTTRKALSLCISVWYFGNGVDMQLAIGAGLVFLGSLVFGRVSASNEKRDAKVETSDRSTEKPKNMRKNGFVPQMNKPADSEVISSATALRNRGDTTQRTTRR